MTSHKVWIRLLYVLGTCTTVFTRLRSQYMVQSYIYNRSLIIPTTAMVTSFLISASSLLRLRIALVILAHKFEYISVAAQLLQDPRFYKFQLYTTHKNFPLTPIAGPQNCGPGCCSIPSTLLNAALPSYLGGAVAQRVERWTCDQQVVGSNPTRGKAAQQPWASCSHLCASITKQYNLVPA